MQPTASMSPHPAGIPTRPWQRSTRCGRPQTGPAPSQTACVATTWWSVIMFGSGQLANPCTQDHGSSKRHSTVPLCSSASEHHLKPPAIATSLPLKGACLHNLGVRVTCDSAGTAQTSRVPPPSPLCQADGPGLQAAGVSARPPARSCALLDTATQASLYANLQRQRGARRTPAAFACWSCRHSRATACPGVPEEQAYLLCLLTQMLRECLVCSVIVSWTQQKEASVHSNSRNWQQHYRQQHCCWTVRYPQSASFHTHSA